jgi:hypothetical protein
MMKRTNLLSALLLGCLCGGSILAHAQSPESTIGGEQHLSVGGDINATYLGYGKRWLGGAGVSVDANMNHWLGVESEGNFTFYREAYNFHETTWLGGPRYQFNGLGSSYRFHPYAKFLVGVGEFSLGAYGHDNCFVMAPGAGVDYRVNERWRLRVVDFEYQDWPQFSFGPMQNFAITTGVRYNIR